VGTRRTGASRGRGADGTSGPAPAASRGPLDTGRGPRLPSTTLYINERCCSPPPGETLTRWEPTLSPSPARFRSTIASIVDQPDDLREIRTFHKALADVNRLRIVRRLADGPASVGDLIDHVGLSQPLVSHHLRRLREAGLVVSRRAGRETICSLRPEAFGEVAARERAILGMS
jgi:DNA-binding transcriptional ArsR family regulator